MCWRQQAFRIPMEPGGFESPRNLTARHLPKVLTSERACDHQAGNAMGHLRALPIESIRIRHHDIACVVKLTNRH